VTDLNNPSVRARLEAAGSLSAGLLEGLQLGQVEAWSRMAKRFAPLVYYWCRRNGLQPSDAEDVVQEVFRTVAVKIGDFRRDRAGDTYRGWLRAIARNKLGDFYRAERLRTRAAGGSDARERMREIPDSLLHDEDTPHQLAEETALLYQHTIDLIQTEFEKNTWRAFIRVVGDGVKPRDVADELGMSTNAVYLARSRVLKRIREEFDFEDHRI
jgi:RNA polymerase sigma-70 factor (ECF subfamily)